MTKYAIYTKWYWKDGIISAEEMQNGMKENLVGKTEAEDIIWWKMDDHHHQSMINSRHRLSLSPYQQVVGQVHLLKRLHPLEALPGHRTRESILGKVNLLQALEELDALRNGAPQVLRRHFQRREHCQRADVRGERQAGARVVLEGKLLKLILGHEHDGGRNDAFQGIVAQVELL